MFYEDSEDNSERISYFFLSYDILEWQAEKITFSLIFSL